LLQIIERQLIRIHAHAFLLFSKKRTHPLPLKCGTIPATARKMETHRSTSRDISHVVAGSNAFVA
jgi:hypothetical protein